MAAMGEAGSSVIQLPSSSLGRLTKDVTVNKTQNDRSVARVTIAVEGYNDNTDFVPVTVWGTLAENLAEYCEKGSLVSIEAHLKVDYEENSKNVSIPVISVVADKIFLGDKKPGQEAE